VRRKEPAGKMMFAICVSLRTLLQSLRASSLKREPPVCDRMCTEGTNVQIFFFL